MNLKIIGSIAIVAGTAIGAGMLALPMATAAMGLIPAIFLMLVIWAMSAFIALLMLEVNLHSGVGDNLHTITGKSLGRAGQVVQSLSFLSLLFALTAAYLSGGADLLSKKADAWFGLQLSSHSSVLLFTVFLGGFAALGVHWVDKVSRALFSAMIIALVLVLVFLMPEVSYSSLAAKAATDSMTGVWLSAIPVMFTSFGFHVCIATLVGYLKGDVPSLRKVLLIGSTLPLFCYVLWLLVTFGTVGGDAIASFNGSLAKMISALQEISAQPVIGKIIGLFADLALITSFLGVTLSLFDFNAELIRARNTFSGRLQTWLLTFIPPLVVALYAPGFISLLGFAAIPLVVITVFLPVLIVLKQRTCDKEGYQVGGGKPALWLLSLLGVIIIVAQLYAAL
ncbi:amino acid permease [Shewanella yunxiaonensis]|uniref:Amino acid permease n=1 Tax=Shewanella yunxiaonensis TaxID=2829809 RepID=A0ABX7YRR8_9GAMM|nr:aromatic amino acid transport family protein [Shewanella yunxiaonensis]QUN05213.1 amino acid permease [Shewanella yunxiaonensis]